MFGGYYFGQAYPGQAGAVTPVSSTPSVTTFAGFGGGFAGPVRGGRKKKKRKDEEPAVALQEALVSMVTANAPPLPNTKAVFRPTVKVRGKAILAMEDPVETRRKRIAKDDEEVLMLMKYL